MFSTLEAKVISPIGSSQEKYENSRHACGADKLVGGSGNITPSRHASCHDNSIPHLLGVYGILEQSDPTLNSTTAHLHLENPDFRSVSNSFNTSSTKPLFFNFTDYSSHMPVGYCDAYPKTDPAQMQRNRENAVEHLKLSAKLANGKPDGVPSVVSAQRPVKLINYRDGRSLIDHYPTEVMGHQTALMYQHKHQLWYCHYDSANYINDAARTLHDPLDTNSCIVKQSNQMVGIQVVGSDEESFAFYLSPVLKEGQLLHGASQKDIDACMSEIAAELISKVIKPAAVQSTAAQLHKLNSENAGSFIDAEAAYMNATAKNFADKDFTGSTLTETEIWMQHVGLMLQHIESHILANLVLCFIRVANMIKTQKCKLPADIVAASLSSIANHPKMQGSFDAIASSSCHIFRSDISIRDKQRMWTGITLLGEAILKLLQPKTELMKSKVTSIIESGIHLSNVLPRIAQSHSKSISHHSFTVNLHAVISQQYLHAVMLLLHATKNKSDKIDALANAERKNEMQDRMWSRIKMRKC